MTNKSRYSHNVTNMFVVSTQLQQNDFLKFIRIQLKQCIRVNLRHLWLIFAHKAFTGKKLLLEFAPIGWVWAICYVFLWSCKLPRWICMLNSRSFLHNMSGKITPHIYNIINYCVVAPGILHKVYSLWPIVTLMFQLHTYITQGSNYCIYTGVYIHVPW